MNTKELLVTISTGTTAYEIAEYLLKQNHLEMADECYTIAMEEWISKKNNCIEEGKIIKIPAEENDIIKYVGGTFRPCNDGVSTTRTHDGWRLTIRGQLLKGKSGWLRDENGLYILKDGRRLNGEHEECINSLKIGATDEWNGLEIILGISSEEMKKLIKECNYNTNELLKNYGPSMSEVVYQAFQINRGYNLSKLSTWESCTRYNPAYKGPTMEKYQTAPDCSFCTIGRDETGIPIIVTRIGKTNTKNVLVIAGPHGDERNAQRVIMATQKHFIQHGVPDGTVMYFIPCLSPTMAFADVRGIPNEFWINGKNGEPLTMINGSFKLKTISIPALHNMLEKMYPDEKGVNQLLRTLIQDQKDPGNPKWGVDANRDVTLSLPSSQRFADFIQHLTGVIVRKPIKTKYDGSYTFLFIHGYDSGKAEEKEVDHGCVYGQYNVDNNKGKLHDVTKMYIDFMTQSLFGYINSKSGKENNNKEYFYLNIEDCALR